MTEEMDAFTAAAGDNISNDFSVGGTARKLRALEDALAALEAEVAEWRRVFGHLGNTADEAGNAIIARREALEAEVELLRELETICRDRDYMFSDWLTELRLPNALRALDQFRKEHETK